MNSFLNRIRNNHGAADSRTPTIILIIFILIIVILAYKFIPVKFRAMKFNNALQEIIQSNLQRYEVRTQEQLMNQIKKKGKELGLPKLIPGKNIILKRLPQNRFSATVKYVEVISIPIYGEYRWAFKFKAVEIK